MIEIHVPKNRPPFPIVFDNSMRSAFVECPQKMFWEYMQHYKTLNPSIHLHAGKAWATGLEVARLAFYRDLKDPETSMSLGLEAMIQEYGDFDCPPHVAKSLPRMIEAFTYYFSAFPLDLDLLHPETQEPILFAGRADMVATYAGALSIYDDKTTSQLGASWSGQWDRRSQFSGYAWAANEMGLPVSQIIIRGIAIKKTSIDHAQAITVRTKHHIAEWHEQIKRDIKRAIVCWEEGYWDKNLAESCSSYGGCLFKQPCGAADPAPWLKSNFTIREWNPVTRTETNHEHP